MIENKAFSKEIPHLQTAWDSTSLGLAKTCWRKYYYTMIEQWAPKGSSIHLEFGIAYHKGLEFYDKAKFSGMSHHEAVKATVYYLMNMKHPDGTPWDTDKAHKDYGLKSRYTLVRAIVWYLERFADDPVETIKLDNGKPAVELSFRLSTQVGAPDGDEYLLCGHLDRAVHFGESDFVLDRKTTKTTLSDQYFKQYNPNNQISLYAMAGQVILKKPVKGVIIDAAQLAVGFARFARSITYRTTGQLNEWFTNTLKYIQQAERNAQENNWPMNDTACDKFGGCPFQEICGADPAVRELYLKSSFVKKVWDPLTSRED